jgi:hypothetical protein
MRHALMIAGLFAWMVVLVAILVYLVYFGP